MLLTTNKAQRLAKLISSRQGLRSHRRIRRNRLRHLRSSTATWLQNPIPAWQERRASSGCGRSSEGVWRHLPRQANPDRARRLATNRFDSQAACLGADPAGRIDPQRWSWCGRLQRDRRWHRLTHASQRLCTASSSYDAVAAAAQDTGQPTSLPIIRVPSDDDVESVLRKSS